MPIGDHTPRTYQPGDEARLVVTLDDPAGVRQVLAWAGAEEAAPEILFELDRSQRGVQSGVFTLRARIDGAVPPGEYSATQLTAIDTLGNRRTLPLTPAVVFNISHAGASDLAGPTGAGEAWGFGA